MIIRKIKKRREVDVPNRVVVVDRTLADKIPLAKNERIELAREIIKRLDKRSSLQRFRRKKRIHIEQRDVGENT